MKEGEYNIIEKSEEYQWFFLSDCAIIIKRSRNAPLAQLDRVSGYGPEGRGFESLKACQNKRSSQPGWPFCFHSLSRHSNPRPCHPRAVAAQRSKRRASGDIRRSGRTQARPAASSNLATRTNKKALAAASAFLNDVFHSVERDALRVMFAYGE